MTTTNLPAVIPPIAGPAKSWRTKRKAKFRQGETIDSFGTLVSLLDSGRWIYWNHKPLHPGWIRGMTLETLRGAIRRGILRVALKNTGGGK